jgi:hypothetical protein
VSADIRRGVTKVKDNFPNRRGRGRNELPASISSEAGRFRPDLIRMCGMEHPSTGSRCQASDCRDCERGHSEIRRSTTHASCKQISGFAISGRSASSRSGRPLHERKRVYNKEHKDYHNWDDNENRAWGQFLTENHRQSHEYAKSNKKEQSEYWNYRHSHPDKD